MIRLDELSVRYGRHPSLDRVSTEFAPGEFVLVTGPSGCGKSTLSRCLNGLIPHVGPGVLDGRVLIDGTSTRELAMADLATRVGLVFQNPAAQLFGLTVLDEVEFGPRNLGCSEDDVHRRTSRALDALKLTGLESRIVTTLSGGELQRVAVAGVLAMRPQTLVLDEPTSSLDREGRAGLMAALTDLHDTGLSVVVIEHRLGDVGRHAGRTIVMDRGRIEADGQTQEVFGHRELLRRLGLRRPSDEDEAEWSSLLVPRAQSRGEPVVELRNVSVRLGGREVLQKLDLALFEGEFVALVGDNGCGKTTLAHVLAGLVSPTSGTLHWRRDHGVAGRDVGLQFQNPSSQFFCATVGDEVRFGPSNFGDVNQPAVDALLEAHDLADVADRSVSTLSTGQQQRVALAALLALGPRMIILDEPTLGQDWRHLSRFMDDVAALNRGGRTVLLISHDYKIVHRYADRVILLRDGKIVADGAPAGPHRPADPGDHDALHHA